MRVSSGLLLSLAALWMSVALFCQNVTLAGGDYRGILLVAIAGMVAADLCCVVVVIRGGRLRWAALAVALPSLFIVADLCRRAPAVWGRA